MTLTTNVIYFHKLTVKFSDVIYVGLFLVLLFLIYNCLLLYFIFLYLLNYFTIIFGVVSYTFRVIPHVRFIWRVVTHVMITRMLNL